MAETEYISRDADANGPEPLPVRAFTAHAPPADPSVPLLGPAFVRVAESDEDFFQNLLDDDEFNHSGRLLLADWLAERGDARFSGYLWLGTRCLSPQDYQSTRSWDWNDANYFEQLVGTIPHEVFELLEGGQLSSTGHYREYPSRRAAEDAFCAALNRPATPQQEPPVNA